MHTRSARRAARARHQYADSRSLSLGRRLLPGDDKLIAAMNRDPVATPCSAFMWRVFGLNFITLSMIKYYTLMSAVMPLCILFAFFGSIGVGLLLFYKPKFDTQGADITPFVALFVIETTAWLAIILS